jgi:nucleoside phosphorylase
VATGTYGDERLAPLHAAARDAAGLAGVLGDPQVGGFEVAQLHDRGVQELRLAVTAFLADRSPDETVLVYLSCHGILTARRRLYFAAADTDEDQLAATGLDSRWVIECLDECPARRQVVILDCCFSGAFALAKGSQDVGLQEQFAAPVRRGRGRVVLTASRATEFSFENKAAKPGAPRESVFTGALLEGLRTGDADRNRDGLVSDAEAYWYTYARMSQASSEQTPQRWLYGGEGEDVILARSPAGAAVEPAKLPADLQAGLGSGYPAVRAGALTELAAWLADPDLPRVAAARAVLEEAAAREIPSVALAARAHLEKHEPSRTWRSAQQTPHLAEEFPVPEPMGSPVPYQRKRLIGDRYELDAIIGRGNATEVFRAKDTSLNRSVAVRMIGAHLATDEALQARLGHEAEQATSLHHPSIAEIHEASAEEDGGEALSYAVMEFVDGRTLRDLIRDDGDGLRERAASITAEILSALGYLHSEGFVHTAVTPGHVMLARDGAVKMTGLALVYEGRAASAAYLSPEQAQGDQADNRSDIYSAGCLLYELLTGQPPFTGESPMATAYQQIHSAPAAPSRVQPAAPAWADEIVLKALEKDPAARYQSAGEMRDALISSAAIAPARTAPEPQRARSRISGAHASLPQPWAVIFTALDVEYEAIWEHLDGPLDEREAHGTLYELGTLPARDGLWRVAVVQNGPGSTTASAQLERAARVFAPEIALFLGVAGGRKDVARGDVVAADVIYDYEGGKSTLEGFRSRARTQESTHRLVQRAQQVARQGRWQQRILPRCPEPPPAAFVKPIVTGQKVVTHERSAVGLLLNQVAGDALAVEMEGAGFLRGAYLNKEVDALVIRGISDLLSDKEPVSDTYWQPIASRHAAAFAVELLARIRSTGA